MLFASLGAKRIKGAFKRGSTCALFFEEGAQVENTIESFVQNMHNAKTCGLGSTTDVVPHSQVRGVINSRFYPTQMVDGPMISPATYSVGSGSSSALGLQSNFDEQWIFRTFLCAQAHPEAVTTISADNVDSQMGYAFTTRTHMRIGTPYWMTGQRKIFLGNDNGNLTFYTGDNTRAPTRDSWGDTYWYLGWDSARIQVGAARVDAGYSSGVQYQVANVAPNWKVCLFQPRTYEYYYRQVTGYPPTIRHTMSYPAVTPYMNYAAAVPTYPYVPSVTDDPTDINVQLDFGLFGVRTNERTFLCRITRNEITSQPSTYTPGTTGNLTINADLPTMEQVTAM